MQAEPSPSKKSQKNEQIKKNKEFQHNVKLLQDQAGQLSESDTLRKAKEVYTKAKV